MNTNVKNQNLYNDFTVRFLHELPASGKDENLVFSPLSVLALLYMAADATAGTEMILTDVTDLERVSTIVGQLLKTVLLKIHG